MEATRRNSELRALRDEQKSLFATLGESYYNACRRGRRTSSIDLLVRRIDEVAERIEAVTAELDALNDKKRCPECGAVVNMDSRFCPSCGAKMPEVKQPEPEDIQDVPKAEYCPSWGRAAAGRGAFLRRAVRPLAPPRRSARTRPSRKWRSTGPEAPKNRPPKNAERGRTADGREKAPALATGQRRRSVWRHLRFDAPQRLAQHRFALFRRDAARVAQGISRGDGAHRPCRALQPFSSANARMTVKRFRVLHRRGRCACTARSRPRRRKLDPRAVDALFARPPPAPSKNSLRRRTPAGGSSPSTKVPSCGKGRPSPRPPATRALPAAGRRSRSSLRSGGRPSCSFSAIADGVKHGKRALVVAALLIGVAVTAHGGKAHFRHAYDGRLSRRQIKLPVFRLKSKAIARPPSWLQHSRRAAACQGLRFAAKGC